MMIQLTENVAKTMAEHWNGGEWDNEIFYNDEQRRKWKDMASKVIDKILETHVIIGMK